MLSDNELLEIKKHINNWRALHFYPLQAFRVTLAGTAANMKDVVIAQRLKRLPTTLNKLQRFKTTPLARMQDIGVARAICKDMDSVKKIESLLNNKDRRFKYELIRKKDYSVNVERYEKVLDATNILIIIPGNKPTNF